MRVVMETPHLIVTVSQATSVVRYVRTSRGFSSAAETIRQHVELGQHLDALKREDYGLLVDVREAPFNPSAAFETAIAESRKHLFRGFARAAILVRTAVGVLQLARHVREDGLEIPVLRDEQEALRILVRTSDAPPSSRSWAPLSSSFTSPGGPPSARPSQSGSPTMRPPQDSPPSLPPAQNAPPPARPSQKASPTMRPPSDTPPSTRVHEEPPGAARPPQDSPPPQDAPPWPRRPPNRS